MVPANDNAAPAPANDNAAPAGDRVALAARLSEREALRMIERAARPDAPREPLDLDRAIAREVELALYPRTPTLAPPPMPAPAAPAVERPTIPSPPPITCRCGRELDARSTTRCAECSAQHADAQRRRVAARMERGQCQSCEEPATCGRYCRSHAFAEVARRRAGDARLGPALEAQWEAQRGRCAYTGEPLTFGPSGNASIDHRVPVSRGGSNRPDNLQWVSARVNRMKTDLTHAEFLAMCALVLARAHAPELATLPQPRVA